VYDGESRNYRFRVTRFKGNSPCIAEKITSTLPATPLRGCISC
jgi:hypothetical protein